MRVAAYGRVSTEDQAEKDSIFTQIEEVNKFARRNELDITQWYGDAGVSGKVPMEKRNAGMTLPDGTKVPGGLQLLKDAQAGRFDTVIVYKVDRLGRTARNVLNALHSLEATQVGVKTVVEGIDTTTSTGKMVIQMLAPVAEWDRDSIVKRSHDGTDRVARAGGWLGGPTPIGYRLEKNRLVVDEEEAPLIRRIFHLIAEERKTAGEVARLLEAEGVPVPYLQRGKQMTKISRGYWMNSTVCKIIGNRTYMGEHIYNKRKSISDGDGGRLGLELTKAEEQIVRKVPAIISQEMFLAAGMQLKANNSMGHKGRPGGPVTMLKGLIKCQECGGGTYVYSMPGNTGRSQYYYKCSQYVNGRVGDRCQSALVKGNQLDAQVWEAVQNYIKNPGAILAELEAQMSQQESQAEPVEEALAKIEKDLAGKAGERQRYIRLIGKGTIDEDEGDRALDELAREIRTLEERKESLILRRMEYQEIQARLQDANDMLVSLRRKAANVTDQNKRDLCLALVRQVRVTTLKEQQFTAQSKAIEKKVAKIDIDYCFDAPANLSVLPSLSQGHSQL